MVVNRFDSLVINRFLFIFDSAREFLSVVTFYLALTMLLPGAVPLLKGYKLFFTHVVLLVKSSLANMDRVPIFFHGNSTPIFKFNIKSNLFSTEPRDFLLSPKYGLIVCII